MLQHLFFLLAPCARIFAGPTNYVTAANSIPVSVREADLYGVNGLDIVVANSGTDNVGVLLNNGDGTFAPEVTYSTGTGSKPMSVFLADVDGDADPDVVVTNSGTDNVGVLLNNGDGTFAPQQTFSTGAGSKPMSVFVTDVNAAGNPDIVVANSGTDNVGVLLSNGAGTFGAQTLYPTGAGSKPMSVFVTNVNNGNDPDIVVANSGTDNVGVLLSNGAGTFAAQVIYPTGAGSKPMSVYVVDVGGNPDPDIVVANSGTDNVGVLLNNGAGGFGAQTLYPTGAGSKPVSVYVTNVGGTPDRDIVVANSGTDNVGVLLNNAAGVFAAQ
ncbi:unnamed protein product [Rotaria sp. Silwood2]|nr:unnamed protein product [Rotaria sp. Silwood2]